MAANGASNFGLAPGSVGGAVGYRGELSGARGRIVRFSVAALVGGATGAVLLAVLPPGIFRVVALLAGGAVVGGRVGARVGLRLPTNVLRAFVVVVGVGGIIQLVRQSPVPPEPVLARR